MVEHFVPPKFVFITVVTRHDGELRHGGPTTAVRIDCRNAVDDHDAFTWLLLLLLLLLAALLAALMLYFVSAFL
jgi:hypothetical protein